MLESATDLQREIYFRNIKGHQDGFLKVPRLIHKFMFVDLLTCAGEYRQSSDPRSGNVHFGPQRAKDYRPRFTGSLPDHIEADIALAISYLHESSLGEMMRVARFYQKFIQTHPFYDGNKRIARLMVNIYLTGNEQTILWSEFDSNNKFLRKLNRCHIAGTADLFHKLANYLKKYCADMNDFES